jgi:hypothetical protein
MPISDGVKPVSTITDIAKPKDKVVSRIRSAKHVHSKLVKGSRIIEKNNTTRCIIFVGSKSESKSNEASNCRSAQHYGTLMGQQFKLMLHRLCITRKTILTSTERNYAQIQNPMLL